MIDINSKSWRIKKSLAWDFYDPYEEYVKDTDLRWYFCTFLYANKHDNMKKGKTGIILYKIGTLLLSGTMLLLLTKRCSQFVSNMDGRPKVVAGDNASSLEGSLETPLSRRKIPNDDSYCTSAMANYFVRQKNYCPNHPH